MNENEDQENNNNNPPPGNPLQQLVEILKNAFHNLILWLVGAALFLGELVDTDFSDLLGSFLRICFHILNALKIL